VSQANARDALVSALNFHFYFEDRRSAVAPKIVELPASLATKVLLLNELVRQNVRPAELARRLGHDAAGSEPPTDVHHATRIDGVGAALHAVGKRLDLRAA
jgi:antitoxin HicB